MSFGQYVKRLEAKASRNSSPVNFEEATKALNDETENSTAKKMPNSIQTHRFVGADYGASRIESNIGISYSPGFYRNFQNKLGPNQPNPKSNLGFLYRDGNGPITLDKRPESKQKLFHRRNNSVSNSASLPQLYKPRANLNEIRSSLYQQPTARYNPQPQIFYNPQPGAFSDRQMGMGSYYPQYALAYNYSPLPMQYQNMNFIPNNEIVSKKNPTRSRRSGSMDAEVERVDTFDIMLVESNLAKQQSLLSAIVGDIGHKEEKKHLRMDYLQGRFHRVKREMLQIESRFDPLANRNLKIRVPSRKQDRK